MMELEELIEFLEGLLDINSGSDFEDLDMVREVIRDEVERLKNVG